MTDPLFDLLLRVVAVLVVATLIVTAMHRQSASLRALTWTAALTGALVLPLISLASPSLEIGVLPAERATVAPIVVASHRGDADAAIPAPVVANARTEIARPVESTVAERTIAESNTDARTTAERSVPASAQPATATVFTYTQTTEPLAQRRTIGELAPGVFTWFTARASLATLFVGIWTIGALLLLVRLALSHKRLDDLVASAGSADNNWHATVDAVRVELGIRRRVDVRTSHDIDIPAVAGVFSPVLLLPASIHWSASDRRVVVLHELAHVARWDALAQLMGHVACAIYWFIPLTWYAARHAGALREQACDNVVLGAGTRASTYAERLLTLSRAPMSTTLEPVALAMARPARIQRRVLGILDPNARRTRLSASFTTTFIAASLAMVAFVAIVQPVAASEPVQVRPTPPRPPAPPSPPAPPAPPSARTAAVPPAPSAPPAPHAPLALDVAAAPASPLAAEVPAAPASPLAPRTPLAPDVVPLPPDAPMVFQVPDVRLQVPASAAQQTAVICKGGTQNHSINRNSNDDEDLWRITAKGPGCEISIRIEGKPTFNREFTDVVRIAGDGSFEIDVRENGTRRELRIRDNDGRITRTWRVDGRERPYDAEAAAWFGQVLIALDRQTAFAVDVRLPILLERGGVNAVLAETRLISSDYARSRYYNELSKKRDLSSQEVAQILEQGAELTKSDYYAAELLKGVGRQGLGDPVVRDGVMRLIGRMKSDYYKSESIKATVQAGRPTNDELELLIRAVGTMESDYYRAESIKLLTRTADLSPEQLGGVLTIVSTMSSDYHINEMLGSLVARGRGTLDTDKRRVYLTATRAIDSDYHRAEALGKLLANGAPTSGEMDLLFTVISEIDSDHHMGEVLDRLLDVRSLREADLLRAEVVARSIGSDHGQSEVLRRIGGHSAATEAVRSAVQTAASSLSRHYREQVLRAVER